MTLIDYFIQQYDYVTWADDLCLTAGAGVSDATYKKEFGFSFGSVHAVLVHMMGAQLTWLGRLKGDSSIPFPAATEFATLDDIRKRWDAVHEEFAAFVRGQTDISLMQPVHYVQGEEKLSLICWQILTHVLDHATYHRGQLNSLIKLAGGKPGNFRYRTWAQLNDEQSI